jgi:deoxycytidylate deaminase
MELIGYSRTEVSYLNLALKVAMESECRQRVGAVVVKGGCVLATACNRDYNDPNILEAKDIRMHASICAERRALAMISDDVAAGAVVYVARARRVDSGHGCSKPCNRCEKVLNAAGIKRAVYIEDLDNSCSRRVD